MTKAIAATLFFWTLILSTSASLALSSEPPSQRKYISRDRSFELSVPSRYGVHTGKEKPSRSYIPVCHDESLVCITAPRGEYEGTTFGDASLEVTLLTAKTMKACLSPGKYESSTSRDALFKIDAKDPSRVINGTRFVHASVSAAAMSHDIAIDLYRGYENGRCYELALQMTFTNFNAYPPGAMKEFTKQEQKQVHAQLEQILDSFRSLK